MAYTRDWDETKPIDHKKFIDIPGIVRNLKTDIAERLKEIFYGFISGETSKGIKRLLFQDQTSDPTDNGTFYTKGGELYYKDGAGNILQVTSNGKLNDTLFRSGDMILSSNTTPPSGWSDVSTTYENKFIRISSGTPLTTGGADTHDHGAGSYAAESHTHNINYTGSTRGWNASRGTTNDDNDAVPRGGIKPITSTATSPAITGTSASASNVPAYIQLRLYQKS